jgi:hypothetical protein
MLTYEQTQLLNKMEINLQKEINPYYILFYYTYY